MAQITAAQVKALRDETGLPMMECKAALTEAGGDKDQAVELLTKKHKGKMEARSDRETGEGRIAVYINEDATIGGIIEFRCESAPVAKNELFTGLADKIARQVAEQSEQNADPEVILGSTLADEPGKTISDLVTEVYGKLRETMKLIACRRVTGNYLTSYIHHDGKTGVLIALDAKPSDDNTAVDLCHHVAFSKPLAITRESIPAETVEKVRRQARDIAEGEGKPANIIDKIVEGKVNAFYADHSLMEQEHVKVSKTKVQKVLQDAGVKEVTDLALLQVGA